jgi:hypothetical protein
MDGGWWWMVRVTMHTEGDHDQSPPPGHPQRPSHHPHHPTMATVFELPPLNCDDRIGRDSKIISNDPSAKLFALCGAATCQVTEGDDD